MSKLSPRDARMDAVNAGTFAGRLGRRVLQATRSSRLALYVYRVVFWYIYWVGRVQMWKLERRLKRQANR